MYTFDWPNKIIIMDNWTTTADWQIMYSKWKEWVILTDNSKYLPAFSVIWWQSVWWWKYAGIIYFMTNWWKVRPYESTHTLTITWNCFWEWWAEIFVPTLWNYNVMLQMTNSNLAQWINTSWWTLTAADVWAYINRTLTSWWWSGWLTTAEHNKLMWWLGTWLYMGTNK